MDRQKKREREEGREGGWKVESGGGREGECEMKRERERGSEEGEREGEIE